jgi:acetylornithine deacetylase
MNEATRLLRDLVQIPSQNPMGRPLSGPDFFEYQVTDFLEAFFRELDVPYERQTIAPKRDNIVARYEPPGAIRTLMFEAHQDTVPAEHMTIDPFGGHIENGRLHGRGACDVKGGMASMLAAFARLVRERPQRSTAVSMACVVDEEFTFRGILELVCRGPLPDLAVVAEPTQLAIVNAHKGVVRWHLTTTGRSCHSSSPEQGVNAIYRMGRILTAIDQYASKLRASKQDPQLGPPTMSVGRIEGGTAVNLVPDRCTIEIDRRLVGGESPELAPRDLVTFLKSFPGVDFPIECDQPWMSKPALTPDNSGELVERLSRAIDGVIGSHRVMSVPYGTDASTLAEAGVPAVVFGPGDIAKAHTCDEWIALDEVEQASEILYRLALQE